MNKTIKKAGNTVIEVLVATAVVGLILTSLALLLSNSIKNSSEAQYREVATRLAQDTMEVFRKDRNVMSWNDFLATPSNGNYCVPSTFTSVATASFTNANLNAMINCPYTLQDTMNFHRAFNKTAILDVSETPNISTVKITVYVYWNVGITGKQRSTSVEQTFYKQD